MNRDAKVYHCRRCGCTLGVIERGELVIGAARIVPTKGEPVRISCVACNHPTTWRPATRKAEQEKVA